MRKYLWSLACTFLAAAVTPAALAADAGAATGRVQAATAAKPELQLKMGMPADAVSAIMGMPREKSPMKAPTGKAEVWTYVRTISDLATQIEVGAKQNTDTLVGSDGIARTVIVSTEPIYKMAHTITEEEVSLLMFNDHFVQTKVVQRTRRSIH